MAAKTLLFASNCRGNITELCELADNLSVSAVIHVGEFGLFDNDSIYSISDELLLRVMESRGFLAHHQISSLDFKDRTAVAKCLNKLKLQFSDFSVFVTPEKNLTIPIYVIVGDYEDPRLVQAFLRESIHVPNLTIITNNSFRLPFHDDSPSIRVFGFGSTLSPQLSWLPDNSNSASMSQIAEFGAQAIASCNAGEVRILASTSSFLDHAIVGQLGAFLDVDCLVSSSHSMWPAIFSDRSLTSLHQQNHSRQHMDQELTRRLNSVLKEDDGHLSNHEKLLVNLAERIWKREPSQEFDPIYFTVQNFKSGYVLLKVTQTTLQPTLCTKALQMRGYHRMVDGSNDESSQAAKSLPSTGSTTQSSPSFLTFSAPAQAAPSTVVESCNKDFQDRDVSSIWEYPKSQPGTSGLSTPLDWDTTKIETLRPPNENVNINTAKWGDHEWGSAKSRAVSGSSNDISSSATSLGTETNTSVPDIRSWDAMSEGSMDSSLLTNEPGTLTLWVGNLNENITEADIRGFFRNVEVLRVRLSKKCPDKRPCAYVDINEHEMEAALNLSGERLHGVRIKVEYDPSKLSRLRRRKPTIEAAGSARQNPSLRKSVSAGAFNVNSDKPPSSEQGSIEARTARLAISIPSSVTPLESSSAPPGPAPWGPKLPQSSPDTAALTNTVPAGWTSSSSSNASTWDSPPKKQTSFSTGANWEKQPSKTSTHPAKWEPQPSTTIPTQPPSLSSSRPRHIGHAHKPFVNQHSTANEHDAQSRAAWLENSIALAQLAQERKNAAAVSAQTQFRTLPPALKPNNPHSSTLSQYGVAQSDQMWMSAGPFVNQQLPTTTIPLNQSFTGTPKIGGMVGAPMSTHMGLPEQVRKRNSLPNLKLSASTPSDWLDPSFDMLFPGDMGFSMKPSQISTTRPPVEPKPSPMSADFMGQPMPFYESGLSQPLRTVPSLDHNTMVQKSGEFVPSNFTGYLSSHLWEPGNTTPVGSQRKPQDSQYIRPPSVNSLPPSDQLWGPASTSSSNTWRNF